MIIVRLKGGLGNQMFQYALGRVLSLKKNTALGLDISFYNPKLIPRRQYDLDVFNISGRVLSKEEIPFFYRFFHKIKISDKVVKHEGKEKFFSFDSKIFSLGENAYLDGYWQSPKYFAGYEDTIRKDFTVKDLPSKIKNFAEEIKSQNSLCIHVRRGDYVGNTYHEVVGREYYENGIEYIKGRAKIDKIYVFSDDINWCRENLLFEFPTIFVGEEYAGTKGEGHMFLMSNCRNFIIANSSFSWWGAWLSSYENKIVVCPKRWFSDVSINTDDLIPRDLVRI